MQTLKISEISIKGFKSIGTEGQTIPIGDVTVLLGANGAGKSNMVSFFTLLNYLSTGTLGLYVGKHGVERLLHYGSKHTESLEFSLKFSGDQTTSRYEARLAYGLPDRLFFAGEKVSYHAHGKPSPYEHFLSSGGSESALPTIDNNNKTARFLYKLLSGIRAYHFHDTSEGAKIKHRGYVDDAGYLRSDAGNLAAFLRMLKQHSVYNRYYQRIVRHVQTVMPQFGDFVLDSIPGNENYVRLNWKDSANSDYLYDPHQISDGSLRFMALTTLFLQPRELLPKFIVVDEPELGLHPTAIAELAGMIRSSSANAQILVATQSTRLVDEFSPEQIVIVEHDKQHRHSTFRQLSDEALGDWIERYSLSELWEKNVLGGQP